MIKKIEISFRLVYHGCRWNTTKKGDGFYDANYETTEF